MRGRGWSPGRDGGEDLNNDDDGALLWSSVYTNPWYVPSAGLPKETERLRIRLVTRGALLPPTIVERPDMTRS